MFDWLTGFLALRGLPPHGYCLLWEPSLVWTHVISDALIAAAYFSIPLVLWQLVRMRRDLAFSWMLALFAVFIMACGLTHVMSILTLWVPAYGWEGLIKGITAVASVGTAALLIPLLPKLLAIPSPELLRAANEQLRIEAAERQRTEELLRQAQKMEAVGQLTGGIAHDFNNLLTVVIGNIDKALRRGGSEAPALSAALGDALAGAERAAQLTDQLLAFSRRQPLQARPLDLNGIVTGLQEILERTLESGVEVEVHLEENLPQITGDRNQLENALLNLAINARDAMPEGGILEISTHGPAPQHPGQVELRVRDTGTGMDPETLARAPDPFFTTKPVGKGTGLGLSQVYGLARQLGGSLNLLSEPGTGTTASLFLPIDDS